MIAASGARIVTNSVPTCICAPASPRSPPRTVRLRYRRRVDGLALDEDDDVLREMRLVQMFHGGLGFKRTWTPQEFFGLAVANGRKATGAPGTESWHRARRPTSSPSISIASIATRSCPSIRSNFYSRAAMPRCCAMWLWMDAPSSATAAASGSIFPRSNTNCAASTGPVPGSSPVSARLAAAFDFAAKLVRSATGLRLEPKHFASFMNSVLRKKIPLASAGGQGFMVSNKKLNRRHICAGHPAMGKRDGRVVASADCRDRERGRDELLRAPVRRFRRDRAENRAAAGDPLRRAAPLTPKGHSAWFAFLNFNKSSVALDPNDAGASSRLAELIAACDILLDGRDIDAADCPAFDLAAIKQRHPGLIHLEASWFGGEGPYANFEATDSTIRALTGLIKLVGPAEGPPMHAPDFQTGILAGLWGFIAAASSVLGRMQDGRGRSHRSASSNPPSPSPNTSCSRRSCAATSCGGSASTGSGRPSRSASTRPNKAGSASPR